MNFKVFIYLLTILTTTHTLLAMEENPTITVDPATPTLDTTLSQHSNKIIDVWVDTNKPIIISISYQEVHTILEALKALKAKNSLALAHFTQACRKAHKQVDGKFIGILQDAGLPVEDNGNVTDQKVCFIVFYAVEFKLSPNGSLVPTKILKEDEFYTHSTICKMVRSHGI